MTKKLCVHGKETWERCRPCEVDILTGKSTGFTPAQAPSKERATDQQIATALDNDWKTLCQCYTSLDEAPRWLSTHILALQELQQLRAAHEPRTLLDMIENDRARRQAAEDACAEFVRMQHDIASLLGVDADTDSISLHDRIYGALSARAAQPPGVPRGPTSVYLDHLNNRAHPLDGCDCTACEDRRATSTKSGEQA